MIARVRCALAATALIEQNDEVGFGIEKSSPTWRRAGAGPSMKDNDWLSSWIAGHVPIDMVSITDVEHAAIEGLNVGIQRHFAGLADEPRARPVLRSLPTCKIQDLWITSRAEACSPAGFR